MHAHRWVSLSLCFVLAAAVPPAATAGERDQPGEIVLTLEPGASIDQVRERHGVELLERIPGTTTYRVRAERSRRSLRRLRKDNAVHKASPNVVVRRHQTVAFPNDAPGLVDPSREDPAAAFAAQIDDTGGLESLQVDSAGALTESGEEVLVAVLDTGVALDHPVFAGRVWTNAGEVPANGLDDDGNGYVDDAEGWDFVADGPDPSEAAGAGPIAGHGTFIAGLIALTAPRARIMPLRVLDPTGVGSAYDAAEAINYAAQNGARVVTMSFGADGRDAPRVLREAIVSARELGVVLVAAVGNNASQLIPYPASDAENVISVGASDSFQNRAPFSNYAPESVDAWAPGVSLVSAAPGTYEDGRPAFARWSGTSFAAALVAAGCSVLLSTAVVTDPDEVRARVSQNGPKLQDGSGTQVSFFEAVGSILRDAGALDVWSVAGMYPDTAEVPARGYVLMRTIGRAQRLTAYVWDLAPFGEYHVFVIPLADRDQFLLVNEGGPVRADQFGGVKFVASSARRPGDPTAPLPLPLEQIWAVALVDASTGRLALGGVVDPASEFVAVWAAVGLGPADPDAQRSLFGRAWYGFEPHEEGSFQSFDVAACGVEPGADYALVVNGEEVVRRPSVDHDGIGSIEFYFSSDPEEIANGAIEISAATTPELFPVTRARSVEIYRVERDGTLSPIPTVGGSFAGAEKLVKRRR
jgi:thermitase